MRCASCGHELQPGMKFCGECGAKQQEVSNTYVATCSVCGLEVPVGSKFCGGCGNPSSGPGTEVGVTYAEDSSGIRGSKEQHARVKYYYGKASYLKDVVVVVERFLGRENLITQVLDSDNGFIIQGKQKSNIFKTALGLDMAITITIALDGNDLKSSIGAGKWMDKAIGAGIGILIFWPALLTTSWGVYMQQKLFSKIEVEIEHYLASVY